MELSTFLLLDRDPARETPPADLLRDALAGCVLAEDVGLDGVWVAEHHFRPFGGCPDPAVFLAAAAGVTERVHLGSAVAVLPFRHPVQVAESYAMVHQISGGRLRFGVGSGALPFEFDGFGVPTEDKRARLDESLGFVERLWAGEAPAAAGRFHALHGEALHGPCDAPVYVATTHPDGAAAVGASGRRLLTLVSGADPDLDATFGRVRRFRAAGGEHAALMLFAHVAATREAALARFAPSFAAFAEGHGMAEPGAGEGALHGMMAKDHAVVGDADDFAAVVRRARAAGVTELILWARPAELPLPALRDCLRRASAAVAGLP